MLFRIAALASLLMASSVWGFQSDQNDSALSSHYISDDLFIFIHTGPGTQYRIIGSVEAGMPVTPTSSVQTNDFVEIIDPDGRTGWIESRYLQGSISRRALLPQLREQAAQAQAPLAALRRQVSQLNAEKQAHLQEKTTLESALEKANQDIANLQTQVKNNTQDEQIRWLINGGALAAGSVLLGVLLTYLPKKRKRHDGWMN